MVLALALVMVLVLVMVMVMVMVLKGLENGQSVKARLHVARRKRQSRWRHEAPHTVRRSQPLP
ncbi:MAG: hypothetical protein KGK00_19030 [Paracoccaceae bacterium]|nr:hypothetical protein [Paracoccaceae bacterium]